MKVRSYDLRKQPLMMEMGVSLQLEIEGYEPAFNSALIGVVPDECLIVRAPHFSRSTENGRDLLPGLEEGINCNHHGSVLGFRSRLIREISEPSRLLLLEYPSTIDSWGTTAF